MNSRAVKNKCYRGQFYRIADCHARQRQRLSQTGVAQRGKFAPDALQVGHIDRRDDDAFTVTRSGQHPSPGVDYHRIAIVAEAMDIWAKLRGSDHIALVLDRPGANQYLPVRFAGGEGKGARNRQNSRARQNAKRRKSSGNRKS